MNPNVELSLLEAEEKQQLDYIWKLIPEQDRHGMNQTDVLLVLDLMDDFLMENGLLEELGALMSTCRFGGYVWNLHRLKFGAAMEFADAD